ncbi:hypothetical protein Rhal01_03410 [Rubritalea halochordaticola]|uniref:Uncharacterized protein n=2 Tax=Rubritalea halochordaticola TaxID=714537 RepID=A0ABP9V3I0_9BACT
MSHLYKYLWIGAVVLFSCKESEPIEFGEKTTRVLGKAPSKELIIELSVTEDSSLAYSFSQYFISREMYEAAYTWLVISQKMGKNIRESEINTCIQKIKINSESSYGAEANKLLFKPTLSEHDRYRSFFLSRMSYLNEEGKFTESDLNAILADAILYYLPDNVFRSEVNGILQL